MVNQQRHEEKGTGRAGITDNALPLREGFLCIKKRVHRFQQTQKKSIIKLKEKFGNGGIITQFPRLWKSALTSSKGSYPMDSMKIQTGAGTRLLTISTL